MLEQYKPSQEEIKKAEEMMSPEQRAQSSKIEKGFNLGGFKEKIGKEILKSIDAKEIAQIVFNRLKDTLDASHSGQSIGESLTHLYSLRKIAGEDIANPEEMAGDEFTNTFIHEFISLAKDFIESNKDLDKKDKIEAFETLGALVDSDFKKDYEAEHAHHGEALKKQFAQVKEELENEIG